MPNGPRDNPAACRSGWQRIHARRNRSESGLRSSPESIVIEPLRHEPYQEFCPADQKEGAYLPASRKSRGSWRTAAPEKTESTPQPPKRLGGARVEVPNPWPQAMHKACRWSVSCSAAGQFRRFLKPGGVNEMTRFFSPMRPG